MDTQPQITIPGQLLIPIPAARKTLGDIGLTTIYSLVNKGLLKKVSIGRRSFITAESLSAYVEELASA